MKSIKLFIFVVYYEYHLKYVDIALILGCNHNLCQEVKKQKLYYKKTMQYLSKIGEGGFCSIYQNDQDTIYKIVNKKTDDKNMISCIQNEIQIYKRLVSNKYRYMLQPKKIIDNDNIIGMSIERGHISLYDYIKQMNGSIKSINDIASIMQQLFLAIQSLHQIGIIHTDVKTQNIMLKFHQNSDISIFLIDFGLSQFIEEKSEYIKGTDTLIDPQMIWGLQINFYTDFWSIGSMLLQLFSPGVDFKYLETNVFKQMKKIEKKEEMLQIILNKQIAKISCQDTQTLLKQLLVVSNQKRTQLGNIHISKQIPIVQMENNPFISSNLPIIKNITNYKQLFQVFIISNNIIFTEITNNANKSTVVINLQGNLFFNNSQFFLTYQQDIKRICQQVNYPTVLKQKTISYWQVLNLQKCKKNKSILFIEIELTNYQINDEPNNIHIQIMRGYLCFHLDTKLHIFVDSDDIPLLDDYFSNVGLKLQLYSYIGSKIIKQKITQVQNIEIIGMLKFLQSNIKIKH